MPASPIERLPPEMLVQVFNWHRGDSVPRRALSLVCRKWRNILLDSPILWSHLEARVVSKREMDTEKDRLRRWIELSRSVLLDIVLEAPRSHLVLGHGCDLFELIANTGVDRWRTLKLIYSGHPFIGLAQSFNHVSTNGRSISLRALSLIYVGYGLANDPFSQISRLIIESKPLIQDVYVLGSIPDLYTDPAIFQHAKVVAGNANALAKLRGLASMQSLEVLGSGFSDISLLPPLPERVTLDSIHRSQIMGTPLANIRFLEVHVWIEDTTSVLGFPKLETLILGIGSLLDIRKISAPRVQSLKLGGNRDIGSSLYDYSLENNLIRATFAVIPPVIHMRPTTFSLRIDARLGGETLILVLNAWPQLEYLTLIFHRCTPKYAFINSLETSPLCPRLVDLTLDMPTYTSETEAPGWENVARKMFALRRSLPLQVVRWRCREKLTPQSVGWHVVTRDMV